MPTPLALNARTATALLVAALTCGCAAPTPEQAAERCQSWRNYLRADAAPNVLEACADEMGLAACQKCLNQ